MSLRVSHVSCCNRKLDPFSDCKTTYKRDGSVFVQCPYCAAALAVLVPPKRLFEDEPLATA